MLNDNRVEVANLRKLQGFLGDLDERVDDWLYETVDAGTFLAEERLKAHAPGSIKDLVGVDLPVFDSGSIVTGEAYVTPAFDEYGDNDADKSKSNPEDFPYYVDVGSGIYGERGVPVTAFPSNVMGPIEWQGRMIYLKSHRGQLAQLYSEAAFDDVDTMLDFRIPAHSGKIVSS